MNATLNFSLSRDAASPVTPQRVSPAAVASLLHAGSPCRILDVRSRAEWESAHLDGAVLQPLDVLEPGDWTAPSGGEPQAPLFVLCQAGGRATRAASVLCSAGVPCSVIEGGLDAWKAAGLPVVFGKSKVLPLMRQVQIVIGLVSGVGSALAVWKHPFFGLIPMAMGAGLVFAGVSGTCGLALLMARMPWNRGTQGSSASAANPQSAASCCSTPEVR
jgi:rhodanese-related sulfurtransferase